MDVFCPRCSEPWDFDSFSEIVEEGAYATVDDAWSAFRVKGCDIFASWGVSHGDGKADPGIAVVYDLLGDDMDGAAAEVQDLGLGGY